MGQSNVRIVARIQAPIELVFETLSDHESMHTWPGVSKSKLVTEGSPRNGVGAVRALKTGGLTLHEEVVLYESPNRYDYTIIKGLAVDHLGSVRLTEDGEFVEVAWEIQMSSKIPFFAQIVGKLVRKGLGDVLQHVKSEIESSLGG